MPLPVVKDESPNPEDIAVFRATTVMSQPDGDPHAVEELRSTGRDRRYERIR